MVDGIWLTYRTQVLLAAGFLSFLLKNNFLKINLCFFWFFFCFVCVCLSVSPPAFLVPKEVWSSCVTIGNQTWVLCKADKCSQPLSQLSSPGVLAFAGTGCGGSGHFLCSLDINQAESI